MTDNVNITSGTGTPIATDDIGGVQYQRIKNTWGPDGTANDVDTASGKAFPVQIRESDGTDIAIGGKLGALTETAPATDTASSGLNGRLQRIAQRLTSLIGLLPTALGANGGLKIEGVASGTVVPVSVASIPSHAVTNAGTFAVQATEVDGGNVTLGAKADAKSTSTDTTPITAMSVWKQISASVQAIATSVAGSLTVATHAVTQSGTWTVGSNSATGSAAPANSFYQGGIAATALAAAATVGNLVGAMFDKFGRQVMLLVAPRDLVGTQTTTLSASTSETTIVTAAASTFNDLVMLIVSNTSASTNTRIDFRDTTGGTVLFSIQSNGGQPPVGFVLPVPIPQTSINTNWTAQCATSTTDVRIYAVFAKNK